MNNSLRPLELEGLWATAQSALWLIRECPESFFLIHSHALFSQTHSEKLP